VVQRPLLRELLRIALANDGQVRCALNAGAGEGLFSDLLLGLPGLESLEETDISYDTYHRTQLDARHKLRQASVTSLPFESGAFDLALFTEVLEHVEDDAAAVAELSRVLRPGGWLLISVPTPPALPDAAHIREGYGSDQLSRLLADQSLTIVATRFCMYGAFKAMLLGWHRFGWLPRGLIWLLAQIDRRIKIGSPMDIVLLARAADAVRE
jgi:SAM-dependent methyltransferase